MLQRISDPQRRRRRHRKLYQRLHIWSEQLTASRLRLWISLPDEFGSPELYSESLQKVVDAGIELYWHGWNELAAADTGTEPFVWHFVDLPQGSIDGDDENDQQDQKVTEDDPLATTHCRRAWT